MAYKWDRNGKSSLQIYKTQLHTHAFRLHSHVSWEMLYYIENSGVLHLEDGTDIPFVPGKVICVPPTWKHGSEAAEGDFVNISIEDPAFPLAQEGNGGCIVTEDNYDRELFSLFTMIYRLHTDTHRVCTEHTRQERICHLLTCVYDILTEQLTRPQKTTDGVAMVKGYLQDRYMDTSCTAAMAIRDSGYSQNYMRSQFLQQCGMTPAKYLTELRLEGARWLLEGCSPGLPIAEVAKRSGFEDALYFSRVFRQRYGMPPTQYAKIHGRTKDEGEDHG